VSKVPKKVPEEERAEGSVTRLCGRGAHRVGARARFALAVCAALSGACSSSLARPAVGRVPKDAFIEVPYPPPPARVEVIPRQPNDHDAWVWVDGQWEWDGKAWKWTAGAWVMPPAGATFTRWTAVRRSDGRLFFARAAWRDRTGRSIDVGGRRTVCPAVPAEAAPKDAVAERCGVVRPRS
jgi:hypothetical protein